MVAIPDIVSPDRLNDASVFLDHNLKAGRSAKTAIYSEGKTYSYAQVAELANRMGNALHDLGVDMEQRVAMLLLDSPEFAATFFGNKSHQFYLRSSHYDTLWWLGSNEKTRSNRQPCTILKYYLDQLQLMWRRRRRPEMIALSGCTARGAPVFPRVASICSMICSIQRNIMPNPFWRSMKTI